MSLIDLLVKNRSYRRFCQDQRISEQELLGLVGLTRYCASGRNAQALKYGVVTEADKCEEIFPHLAWAGYLTDWDGPEQGERPAAYLVQMLDTRITENCLCDDGIQAQTILLGAVEKGWGGCIIKAFKNDALRTVLGLPEHMKIMYVIALGKPCEKVIVEEMEGDNFKYWRDREGGHHVPKRKVEELIFRLPDGK